MTKFFKKFKKRQFWTFLAHFPNFLGKIFFSMKSSCYVQLLIVFWHHAKIQRNLIIQFQENTLFHRILLATVMVLTRKTAVNWHLPKVLLHQSQHAKKHQLIQQILRSHKLHGHIHHIHPNINEITFNFPEFVPACQKSVHSINSFLRYSRFQSPATRLTIPISDHAQSKNF